MIISTTLSNKNEHKAMKHETYEKVKSKLRQKSDLVKECKSERKTDVLRLKKGI